MKIPGFVSRVGELVKAQLRQGADPWRLSLAVVLAVLIGIIPLLGTTTVLCVLVASVLRLNHAVMQAVNYLVYPLQIALLPVFLRAGTRVFAGEPVEFDLIRIKNEFFASIPDFLARYGSIGAKAVGVWLAVSVVAGGVLIPVLERFLRRVKT